MSKHTKTFRKPRNFRKELRNERKNPRGTVATNRGPHQKAHMSYVNSRVRTPDDIALFALLPNA